MNKRGGSKLGNTEVVVRKWNVGVDVSAAERFWVTARSPCGGLRDSRHEGQRSGGWQELRGCCIGWVIRVDGE